MNLLDAILLELDNISYATLTKCTTKEQQTEVIKQKFVIAEALHRILDHDVETAELEQEQEATRQA